MKTLKITNILLSILVGALLMAVILLTTGVLASPGLPGMPLAGTPRMHYQGRLLDPVSGLPKVDGNYPMSFGLYDAATSGTLLWTETKDVSVTDGIFSTLLGDTTPLDLAVFNGQDLWLGVTVSADPQMTPRQPLAYVPYAVYASNADLLDSYNSSDFASSSHTHSPLPDAFGYVSQYSGLQNGSYNVDSAVWNDSLFRYEITLTNFLYSTDDVTVATTVGDTGSCPAGAVIRTSSVNGKLLVYIINSAGTKIECSFHFVSFAGQ